MTNTFAHDLNFGGIYGRVYEDDQGNHYTSAGEINSNDRKVPVHYEKMSGIIRRDIAFCLKDIRIDELNAERIRSEASGSQSQPKSTEVMSGFSIPLTGSKADKLHKLFPERFP